jgi:hypothetical protein
MLWIKAVERSQKGVGASKCAKALYVTVSGQAGEYGRD